MILKEMDFKMVETVDFKIKPMKYEFWQYSANRSDGTAHAA